MCVIYSYVWVCANQSLKRYVTETLKFYTNVNGYIVRIYKVDTDELSKINIRHDKVFFFK